MPDKYGLPVSGRAVMLRGSGLADYSTTSLSYVDVDSSLLSYATVVPSGSFLFINVVVSKSSTSNAGPFIAIADGVTPLAESTTDTGAGTQEWGVQYLFVGDGASHQFKLQYKTGAGTLTINNSTPSKAPTMIFLLL